MPKSWKRLLHQNEQISGLNPKTDAPRLQKNQDAASPAGSMSGYAAVAGLTNRLMDTNGNLEAQAAQMKQASLQTMQRQAVASQIGQTQGNSYFQQLIGSLRMLESLPIQRAPDATSSAQTGTPTATITWSTGETIAIQIQLKRLGFYQIRIDGIVGKFTESGLVEAFGGDEWRTLEASEIVERLEAAEPPTGEAGEHRLRYGEMFRDGLLDMSLGVGFAESGDHKETIEKFREVLAGHQFKEDPKAAVEIYKQAGRAMEPSAFGVFFVRENALIYKPPAGAPRPIHAVVRLITSPEGDQGEEAASAFTEGLVQSDIAYYSGHGRYGSGPDFNRDYDDSEKFELLDSKGNITKAFADYDDLGRYLREEGIRSKPTRTAWEQFLWRVRHKRINIPEGINTGNVYLNAINQQPRLFGAQLMHWQLKRKKGGGRLLTGKGGPLAAEAKAHRERRYRLLVFDGCYTRHYERSIRATPGFSSHTTDLIGTSRTINYGDDIATLATFLDLVLGQQSAEQIVKSMDALQVPVGKTQQGRPAYTGKGYEEGFKDNPVIK